MVNRPALAAHQIDSKHIKIVCDFCGRHICQIIRLELIGEPRQDTVGRIAAALASKSVGLTVTGRVAGSSPDFHVVAMLGHVEQQFFISAAWATCCYRTVEAQFVVRYANYLELRIPARASNVKAGNEII